MVDVRQQSRTKHISCSDSFQRIAKSIIRSLKIPITFFVCIVSDPLLLLKILFFSNSYAAHIISMIYFLPFLYKKSVSHINRLFAFATFVQYVCCCDTRLALYEREPLPSQLLIIVIIMYKTVVLHLCQKTTTRKLWCRIATQYTHTHTLLEIRYAEEMRTQIVHTLDTLAHTVYAVYYTAMGSIMNND